MRKATRFNNETLITPPITGTEEDFIAGQELFNMYCVVCHGQDGKGNGPASSLSDGGYITHGARQLHGERIGFHQLRPLCLEGARGR